MTRMHGDVNAKVDKTIFTSTDNYYTLRYKKICIKSDNKKIKTKKIKMVGELTRIHFNGGKYAKNN